MEKIISINSLDMYEKTISLVDGVCLGCLHSFYAYHNFSNEEIHYVIDKNTKLNKKTFILLNLVMHQNKVEEVKLFIDEFKNENVHFIFQDLGVLQILRKLEIENKGIYNPLTMITNYEDLRCYQDLGVDAVGLSNEITLDDVELTTTKSNGVFYLGFGYHPMYQTYRKLASLYKEYSQLDYSLNKMTLKQEGREEVLHFIENDLGCVIFRHGVISTLEEIEKLNDVKYFYLDGIFLNEEKFIKVLNIYLDVIDGRKTKEEGLKEVNELNFDISNEFMNQDSVYNPEDF